MSIDFIELKKNLGLDIFSIEEMNNYDLIKRAAEHGVHMREEVAEEFKLYLGGEIHAKHSISSTINDVAAVKNKVLKNLKVSAVSVNNSIDLGEVSVSPSGFLNIESSQKLINKGKEDEIDFKIYAPDGTLLLEERRSMKMGEDIAPFEIDTTEVRRKLAVPLEAWSLGTGLSISSNLKSTLSGYNLDTLHAIALSSDFRKEVDELPVNSTVKEEAENLLSHAHLSLVSKDVKRNKTLIDHGIDSIYSFASISNSYARNLLPDDDKLAEAKEKAEAFESVRRNRVIEGKVERANGREVDENEEQETQPCECNCTSAVSPLAYLADFLDFVLREVELNNEQLTFEKLIAEFHQPFRELPAYCSASEVSIRQIRIVCEVLRAKAKDDGDVAVKAYVKQVYEALLDALGVSYKTLRLLRNQSESEQGQRRAEALGIAPEKLTRLILSGNQLNEAKLEDIFGLLSTSFVEKHLKIDEVKTPQLIQWQEERQKQVWITEDSRKTYPDNYPVIDPDLLTEAHFCYPHEDNPAYTLWKLRKVLVEDKRNIIDKDDQGNKRSVDEMLITAWSGNNIPPWDQLSLDLTSEDGNVVNETIAKLKKEWHLTPETFQELKASIELLKNPDGYDAALLAETRERVLGFLIDSHKYRQFFAGMNNQTDWVKEEQVEDIVLSPTYFCIPKADGGLNFISALAHKRYLTWREVLESNRQPPIIDPDRLPIIPKGGKAREIFQNRANRLKEMQDQLLALFSSDDLEAHWNSILGGGVFNTSTNELIFTGWGINDNNKEDVKSELQKYELTVSEWEFCLELGQLIASNVADEEDWQEFSHIYIQVHKRRYLYPLWSQEESELNITLSPEYFPHPEESLYQADQIIQRPEHLLKWRGDYKAVRQWLKKLKARYEQKNALYDNLRNVIDQAEQVVLPKLRDALVEVLFKDEGETKTTLEQKKIEASNRLLINAQDNGCKKTTRIAQAIETLQLLVWGVLNKQLEEQKFSIPDANRVPFDSSWEWLQSYGKWRAAMFVFIYPENFLLPSLHHNQSLFFEVARKIISGEIVQQPEIQMESEKQEIQDEEPVVAHERHFNTRRRHHLWGNIFDELSDSISHSIDAATSDVAKAVENYQESIEEQNRDYPSAEDVMAFLIFEILGDTNPSSYLAVRKIVYLSLMFRSAVHKVSDNGTKWVDIVKFRGLWRTDPDDDSKLYYKYDPYYHYPGYVKSDFYLRNEGSSEDFISELTDKHSSSVFYKNYDFPFFRLDNDFFFIGDDDFIKSLDEKLLGEESLFSFLVWHNESIDYIGINVWKNVSEELEDAYLLPLHGANSLQRKGQFEDALKLYRLVYDYQKMEFTHPRVEELLQQRTGMTEHYNEWLIDPINPHRLALTRTGADKRFLLMSIVRCLLEYAEEEFTIDTSESLAHARELYYTAQRVLKESDLAQNLGDCKTGLSIEVGEYETSVGDRLAELKAKEDLEKEKNKKRDLRNQLNNAESQLINTAPSDIEILERMDSRTMINIAGASLNYCIPPNPLINSLHLRVEVGLAKLNNCMNVAGIRREVPAYSAPTDTTNGLPNLGVSGAVTFVQASKLFSTPYRYQVLIEKAKQLISIAQQMEASYLSFLEKYDQESYSLLRAKIDWGIANKNIELNKLRLIEASNGKKLSESQLDKIILIKNHYDNLLNEETSNKDLYPWDEDYNWTIVQENLALQFLMINGILNLGVAATRGAAFIIAGLAADGVKSAADIGASFGTATLGSAILSAATDSQISSGITGGISSFSSYLSMLATYGRRKQEWELQYDLALADENTSNIQKTLSDNRYNIVEYEKRIAELNSDHSQDVINYLSNKFTNAELYHWMSGVIREVYSYFLQQATVTARLAQAQLMFERQEQGLNFILSNYWHITKQGNAAFSADDDSPDRRGMTGSARLLQDIHKLDQHAFSTDRRKLEMSKTISLALLDPIVFQKFRETGSLLFNTTHEMFDRDFPGHYMRLIKRVRVAVIALVPPIDGIKGTLSNVGLSRVMVSPDNAMFEERDITREPESIVLTAANNNNGVLEMQDKPEMFLPFESTGVAASWEFNLPKPANALDFNTIADVLVTIDYTALDSPIYREQVIKNMDPSIEAERPFSFRQQFADAWYDLHHPEQTANPMTVTFQTRREDFPANVQDLSISHVTLYFAHKQNEAIKDKEVELRLRFTESGDTSTFGGGAKTKNLLASTQVGGASSWNPMIGKIPSGEWELTIDNQDDFAELLDQELIEDILFVVNYSGKRESW